jgi:hypothetical protein
MLVSELRKAESIEMTPAMRLLERRKEMQLVDAELEAQKRAYKEQVPAQARPPCPAPPDRARAHASCPATFPQDEVLKRREEELKAKDLSFQDTLLRFTRFMQENDAKCAKAERKAAEERRHCADHDREAEDTRAQIEAAKATKQAQQRELEGLAK